MVDLPNKSLEVYKKIEDAPLLGLDVYYVDIYEAKDSLLSVVPLVLGRCTPRFSFPLSSSPLLPFSLQVTLEL